MKLSLSLSIIMVPRWPATYCATSTSGYSQKSAISCDSLYFLGGCWLF